MHPLFLRRLRLVLYLAAWIPVLALTALAARANSASSLPRAAATLVPATLVLAFTCLSSWYLCRVRPLRFGDWIGLLSLWSSAALTAGALTAGAAWVTAALAGSFPLHYPMLISVGALLYLLSAGVSYAALAAELSRQAESREAEARSLARDAELYALRMQINPHFLFNSLNSIAALAGGDGPRAREMCVRLSDFLRASLGLGSRESIPLAEELAMARRYLDVEQVRFGARLRVAEEIGPGCEGCSVPALLLQPLVENAVKHGVASMIEGSEVRIAVTREADEIRVEIVNAFDPESEPPARLGLGLAQVRRRLEVRYGERAHFDAAAAGGEYRVRLRFPCE